jgi:hypothetical protein
VYACPHDAAHRVNPPEFFANIIQPQSMDNEGEELRLRADRRHSPQMVRRKRIGLAVATAVYVLYSVRSAQGRGAGSALGLTFGIVGFSFMLFAGLLGSAQKVSHLASRKSAVLDARPPVAGISQLSAHPFPWRLSFRRTADPRPDVAFHFCFRQRNSRSRTTALHSTHPHRAAPMETIYEQIDRSAQPAGRGSSAMVEEACSALEGEVSHASELQRGHIRRAEKWADSRSRPGCRRTKKSAHNFGIS